MNFQQWGWICRSFVSYDRMHYAETHINALGKHFPAMLPRSETFRVSTSSLTVLDSDLMGTWIPAVSIFPLLPALMERETVRKRYWCVCCCLTRAYPPQTNEVILVSRMIMGSADREGTQWAIKTPAHHRKILSHSVLKLNVANATLMQATAGSI